MAKKKPEKKKAAEKKETNKKIAAVRIRGDIHLSPDSEKTFELLNLHNKNWCVVLDANPSAEGMLKKVKDYITWGEIDDSTYKKLIEERGEKYKGRTEDSRKKIKYEGRYFTHNRKKYRKYFRLSPPVKGYGREGVKRPFSGKGALGYRGAEINDLLKRMM